MKKLAMRLGVVGAALAVAVALFAGTGQPAAHADPENVVAFNTSLCLALGLRSTPSATGPLADPPAGCLSGTALLYAFSDAKLLDVANRLGNNDGVIQASDFTSIQTFTGGEIHQSDLDAAGTSTNLSALAIVAFVKSDSPVTFHTPVGTLINDLGQPAGQTVVCDANVDPLADTDCGGGTNNSPNPAQHEDHAVVTYLMCNMATCATPGKYTLTVEQDGVVFPYTITVVGEPRTVEFFTLETAIENGISPSQDPGWTVPHIDYVCPFKADLASVTKALGEAEKTVIVARAKDINGVTVTGAWFHWTVDNTDEGMVSQADTPSLDLGGFGLGAPNIVCAKDTATPGTLKVTATLERTVLGGAAFVDPNADPGSASTAMASGSFTYTVIGAPANNTVTADPATLACDGTNTSKVSAAITDSAGNKATGGVEVHFDSTIVATADPIIGKTDANGVATSTIAPLAGTTTGVPVTVSVYRAGILLPDLTRQILISCTPGGPGTPGAPGGAPGGTSGTPVSGITGPNTGTGGGNTGAAGLAWWPALALLAAGLALGAARFGLRRAD